MKWQADTFEQFQNMASIQRIILLLVIVLGTVFAWHQFVYLSKARSLKSAESKLVVLEAQNKDLQSWLALQNRNYVYDHHLISPAEMSSILQRLFHQVKGLKLISMKNLPPVTLNAKKNKKKKKSRRKGLNVNEKSKRHPEILKLLNVRLQAHDIVMVFEGDYFSTLSYLKKIDDLHLPLLWQKINYESLDFPRAKIGLVVRSLSKEKDWLRA